MSNFDTVLYVSTNGVMKERVPHQYFGGPLFSAATQYPRPACSLLCLNCVCAAMGGLSALFPMAVFQRAVGLLNSQD